jgi:glycosyltransferase involved in cell wall biosynthesis
LQSFDLGLVSKSIEGQGHSPLKLYEYWASGLPVLGTNLPGLDIVRVVDGGCLYNMNDPKSLRTALLEMVEKRSEWGRWGENGRCYVEGHASWHMIGANTVAFVEDQIKSAAPTKNGGLQREL